MPYPSSSSAWGPPAAISAWEQSGTSSQTARGKGPWRSSWDDEEDNSQGYGGGGRGSAHRPPPPGRPRLAAEPETVGILVSSLQTCLTSLRIGMDTQEARRQLRCSSHRREVFQPRGTLIIKEIMSIRKGKPLTTRLSESRAGTHMARHLPETWMRIGIQATHTSLLMCG
jgi:hypothetical protein